MNHLAACLLAVTALVPAASPTPPATYLFEWVSTSAEFHGRLTLFLDRKLIWKSESAGDKPVIKTRRLSPDEFAFYQGYFDDALSREAAEIRPSGMTGDSITVSRVDFQIPVRHSWSTTYDSMTSMTPPLLRVVTALEGLRDTIETVLPSPQDFGPGKISQGTVLKHRSGTLFRIVSINADRGVVELEGLTEPYTLFSRVEDLRFSFFAP